MVSEIQRIAQALVAVIDELPGISGLLRMQIRRIEAQASELGDIANRTGDLHARHAALQLHAAAQACGRAVDRADHAYRKGQQWAAQQVGGGTHAAGVRDASGSRSGLSTEPTPRARAAGDARDTPEDRSGPPLWLKKVREGKKWHVERQAVLDERGGVSELYVDQDGGGYNVVDHYNRAERRILSMKHTQLARIGPGTALEYVREASRKYRPGSRIADVPSTPPAIRGLRLQGRLFLFVPVQEDPVPQEVLELAKKLRVQIIDDLGRIYS